MAETDAPERAAAPEPRKLDAPRLGNPKALIITAAVLGAVTLALIGDGVIAAIAGWIVFCSMVGGAIATIAIVARRNGLLTPVLVALTLKALVMVSIHLVAVASGDNGFAFPDERGHLREIASLAAGWEGGSFASPRAIVGSYAFGFQTFMALVFLVTGPHLIVMKIINVLVGTATVLMSGLLAGRLLGSRAAVPVTWIVALMPTLALWNSVALKESLAGLLVVSALLLITQLGRRWAGTALAATIALLLTVRAPMALVVILGGAAALAMALWLVRAEAHLPALARRLTVAGIVAFVGVLMACGGRPGQLSETYVTATRRMFDVYQRSDSSGMLSDLLGGFLSPRPWVLSGGAEGWYFALYPGMWFLYGLFPLALLGLWRGRRRPEILLLAVCFGVLVVAYAVITGSGSRQRSGVEPLIALLAVAAMPSRREALRLAAAGIGLGTLAAAVQGTDPILLVALSSTVTFLWWMGGRLDGPLVPPGPRPEPLRRVALWLSRP